MSQPAHQTTTAAPSSGRRILLLGATGTIGRAAARALLDRGHEVVCFVRPRADVTRLPDGAIMRKGEITTAEALVGDAFQGERFDAVVSCMASRAGGPKDAWAVEYQAQLQALKAAQAAGVGHFVLLSAICVQKPLLEFQRAKLAFESALIDSGLRYSIVRPTAFFKSLSGQIERVRGGKAFLLFGDGRLTACKPIGDEDLGDFLAGCLDDESRWNRILPIGGPGPAITPREQGERLFALFGRPPKFQSVPVGMFDLIIAVLGGLGRLIPSLADKAEFARIGRYYATESMLVFNEATRRYDAEATPSYGTRTLFDHYAAVAAGGQAADLGEHAVFDKRG